MNVVLVCRTCSSLLRLRCRKMRLSRGRLSSHTSGTFHIYRTSWAPCKFDPCPRYSLHVIYRVLDKHRKPLGYIDVAALKTKWEAGEASPVRHSSSSSDSALNLTQN